MRASRLVRLALLLQARGATTAAALAAELEVSPRTVFRDLEALSAAGVPVYAEPGRGGGIRLVEGFRSRLTGLTPDEADAVGLAGLPGPAAELGLGTLAAAAQLKVLAALPAELRSRATRVQERFHLDLRGWYHRDEPVPHLEALAEALWDDRRCRIRYRRKDGVVQRTVEPLGLVCKTGTWYLLARVKGGTRTYRASKVERVEVLDATFERGDLDLAEAWRSASQEFERSLLGAEATLRLPARRARSVAQALEPAAAAALVEQAAAQEPDADGFVTVVVPCERVDWLAIELLAFGPDVQVLEAEGRAAALAAAKALVDAYERQVNPGPGALSVSR